MGPESHSSWSGGIRESYRLLLEVVFDSNPYIVVLLIDRKKAAREIIICTAVLLRSGASPPEERP